jgi:hypothetical protein
MTNVMSQIEFEEQRLQILYMGSKSIFTIDRRLASAEAHMVGNDNAVMSAERWNEMPIQVRPRGFAVQAHDRLTLAFIHVVHPKSGSLREARPEGKGAIEGVVYWDHRLFDRK